MSFERNSYRSVGPNAHILGTVLEYDSNRPDDSSDGWKWAVGLVLVVAVVVSFVSTRGCFRSKPVEKPVRPPVPAVIALEQKPAPPVATNDTNTAVAAVTPKPAAPSVAAQEAERWAENSSVRPPRERALLQRLADAERLGRLAIAVDTIEQLRAKPSMADLDDRLARRLGDLNIRRLFSGEPVPWVVETTVRRGQTVHRIAREHGTTVAAVRQLNKLGPREEPAVDRRLRVLEFPKVTFVVHKQTRYADLTLGGRLFKRYYISTKRSTASGAYPITSKSDEGPRARFAALGIRVAPADMLELDMFLGPGSMLTISEM